MDYLGLLSSLSVALLGIVLWGHLPCRILSRPTPRRVLLGLLSGVGTVGSMMAPSHLQPGQFYDFRAPLLGVAGLIGGPVAGVIAGALALFYRIQLGGIGVWAGSWGIALAVTLGSIGYGLTKGRQPTAFHITILAAGLAASPFPALIVLPHDALVRFMSNAGQVMLVNFLGTWLFSLSLLRDERLRALVRDDAIYRAIIEALPDSLNAKDMDSRFVAANPATAILMQAGSARDLIGRSDADFYPSAIARGFRGEELAVLAGNTVGPIDHEVQFADGSRRWLTSLKTPMRDERGTVCGIITHNRDVTDRKILEADLADMQGTLHEAMANMADGLVLFDRDGVIRFCNQQYRDLFPGTADLRVAGGSLAHILRIAIARGEEAAKEDVDRWIADRLAALRHPGDRLIDLADGRIIEARSRPLAGGDTLLAFTDVTARKRLESDLLRRATHDPLTGLANRAEFAFRLGAARQHAVDQRGEVAVMMMDLDRFKKVNDTFGHAVGDKLLIEVASRLQATIRSGDLVARLGGDEFAFLVSGPGADLSCRKLANRVLRSLRRPFLADGVEMVPGGSLGIAVYPKDTADPSALGELADRALYAAKGEGGGRWVSIGNVGERPPTVTAA